jgi:hypothetical protein
MVGTVFCHAVSNALASAHFDCTALLSLHGVSDASLPQCCHPCDRLVTDDGIILRLHIGRMQPGQKRSSLLRLTLRSDCDPSHFSIQVSSIAPPQESASSLLFIRAEQAVATSRHAATPLLSSTDELLSLVEAYGNEVEFSDCKARVEYLTAVTAAINKAAANPALFFLAPSSDLTQLSERLPPPSSSPYSRALHADLRASAQDIMNEGELGLAFEDSKTFTTWGRHYARSLVRAHQLQQCHNFKDPSVQLYATLAFTTLLEQADCMFVLLPPPREGRKKSSRALAGDRELLSALPAARLAMLDRSPDDMEVSTQVTLHVFTSQRALQLRRALLREAADIAAAESRSSANSMHSYMDRYGGCFDGSQFVAMSAATGARRVCELQRGDVLANGAVVLAVVVMHMPMKSRLCAINGVRISPWHPVSTNDSDWHFPASVAPATMQPIDRLYNVVLSRQHVITINGLHCITLGHGVVDHPVLSHPFFGTQAVISSLRRLPITEAGRIHAKYGFLRDASGLVCDYACAPH